MAKKKQIVKKKSKSKKSIKKALAPDQVVWREPNGNFRTGNPGGPGRPFRREARFMHTIAETVTEDRWQKIVTRAVDDAEDGDRHARDWLSKWLLGMPREIEPEEKRTIIDVLTDGNFIKWIEAGGNGRQRQ